MGESCHLDDRVSTVDNAHILETLLEANPRCRVCGGPSTLVRERSNPKWGLDSSFNPRKEIDEWLAEATSADVVGVCGEHINTARSGNGGWVEPTKTAATAQPWPQKRRSQAQQARSQLVAELGGTCYECDSEAPVSDMRIRTPERVRKELGLGPTEWHRYLAARPELLKLCRLLCLACDLPDSSTNPDRRTRREKVMEAYGGHCSYPECPETSGLHVVPLPGTPALRWPNGDKYTSVAKCAHLVRQGFPTGWALACPRHSESVRTG